MIEGGYRMCRIFRFENMRRRITSICPPPNSLGPICRAEHRSEKRAGLATDLYAFGQSLFFLIVADIPCAYGNIGGVDPAVWAESEKNGTYG